MISLFHISSRFYFIISLKFEKNYDIEKDLNEIPLFLYGNDKLNLKKYLPYYLYHE